MAESILDLLPAAPSSGQVPDAEATQAGANPPMRALERGRATLHSDEERAAIKTDDLRPENLSEFRRAIDTERDPKKKAILQGDYDQLIGQGKQIQEANPAETGLKVLGAPAGASRAPRATGADAGLAVLQSYGKTGAIAPPRPDLGGVDWDMLGGLQPAGQPEKQAPWFGETGEGVLSSTPAGFVAQGKQAVAGFLQMLNKQAEVNVEAQQRGRTGNRFDQAITRVDLPPADLEAVKKDATEAGERMKEWAAQNKRDLELVTPKDMSLGQEIVWSAITSSGSTALGIGVGIATRNPTLAVAVAGGGGFQQQAGSSYLEALDHGATHDVAMRSALRQGFVESLDALPVGYALNNPGTRKTFLTFLEKTLKTAGVEGATEGAQQALQDFDAFMAYNPKMTMGEAWHNFVVAVGAGTLTGGTIGGAGHAYETMADRGAQQPAAQPPARAPGPTPTHLLPDGTPVAMHQEEGKPVPGLWKDEQGNLHEAPAARPLQMESNAEWVVNGIPYEVEVLGKGERPGSAALSDGQEVSIASLVNMDDDAKVRLGLIPPKDVGETTEKPTKPLKIEGPSSPQTSTEAAPAAPAEPPKPPPSMEPTRSLQRQNRLRESAASVEQMNRIANAPDYDRLSFSKAPETGAPMASFAGDTELPAAQLGRSSTVTISDEKVPVRYAVVEAKDLIASNLVSGKRSEEFFQDPKPGELRALNNGRAAGIKEAYGRDTAGAYKSAMIGDPDHGIDPKIIEGMARPVLIRLYPDEWNTKIANIGEASQGETLQLSPLEHALGDAAKLTSLEDFKPDESGDVLAPQNMAFVNRFLQDVVPEAERGRYFDQKGRPNKAAVDRIEAAVFQKAYGSKDLTSMFAEQTDPEIRAVLSALSIASPEMAKLEGAPPEMDLRPYVAESAKLMLMAKRQGVKLSALLAQGDIEGRNPLVEKVAQFMAENVKSPKKMAAGLAEGAKFAQFAAVNQASGDMFGGGEITVSHVLERIKTYMEQNYGAKTEGPSFFTPEGAQAVQAPENQPGARQPTGRYEAPRRDQEGRLPAASESGTRPGGTTQEAVRQQYQNLKGESHAATTGKEQERGLEQHRGNAPGPNVRENQGEVRQGDRGQASGSRGAVERETAPGDGERRADAGIQERGAGEGARPEPSPGPVRGAEVRAPAHPALPTADLRAAARATETEPSLAQIEAGNYAKGKYKWNGLTISLENPKGSIRRAVDGSWEQTMAHHYGYIRGTLDRTGEQIDTFIGPNPKSDQVYVIEQEHQGSGIFDEPKVMIGFGTVEEAKRGYLDNYPRGWKVGPVVPMNVEQFKTWLEGGNTKARPSEIPIEQLIPGLTPELQARAEQIRDQYARGEISDKAYAKFVEKLRSRWSPPEAPAAKPQGAHTVEGIRDEINATEFGRRVSNMVEPVARINDLPEYIYEDVKDKGDFAINNVNGVWDPISRKVYLVAANTDPGSVNQTLLHELVGHYGVESILGPKFSEFLRQVYDSNAPAIQQQARAGFLVPYNLDFTKAAHREIAASEYIAYTAERGENPSLWQRFVAKVREILRSMGFVKEWSENDIRNLLRRSRNSLMHGGDVSYNGETPYEFGQPDYTSGREVQAPRRKGARETEAAPQRDLFTEAALRREEEKYPLIVEPKQVGTMRIGFDKLDTPQKAAHAFAAIRKSPFEKFQMIVTDANDKPIAAWHMFSGTVTQISVYPREVVTAAYMTPGAKKVWFAHNHPSGVASPSHADEILTRTLISAIGDTEVQVAGHVIIAGKRAVAFDVPMDTSRAEMRALLERPDVTDREKAEIKRQLDMQIAPMTREMLDPFDIAPASRKFAIPILERTITRQSFEKRPALTSPRAMRDYLREIKTTESGLVLLDAQHQPLGFWAMSTEEMGKVGKEAGRLYQMIGRLNPAAAVIYSPHHFTQLEPVLRGLKSKLSQIDVSVLDAFAPAQPGTALTSFAERGLLSPPGKYVVQGKRKQRTSERTGEKMYRINVTLYGEPKGKSVESHVSQSDLEARKEYWRKNMPESAVIRATPMWETGPKYSVRQTTFAKDDAGHPLLSGELVDVVNPRFVREQPNGVRIYTHDILVGKTHVGVVMLGWQGDTVTDLPFIAVFPKFKGLGLGEDVVRSILEHNGGKPLRAVLVLAQARTFWSKMGAKFEATEEGEDGILTYQNYLAQNRGRGAARAGGTVATRESAVEEINAGSETAPGAEVPRQRYSIRDPKGLSQVYGVKDGRLQGVAIKSYRGGIWEVYIGKEGNPTLFAQGDFDRIQASDIGEVQRIFNQKGLEFRAIKPTNIPIPDRSIFDRNWVAPTADTFFKRATIYLQNRLLLPELQERVIAREVGPIPEEAKAHREARLAHPRAAGKMADFDHQYTEPIIEEMRKARLTLREVGDYLYARHAEERNVAIEQINPENKSGSGMPTEEAQATLRTLQQDTNRWAALERIGKLVNEVNKVREQIMVDKGLAKPQAIALLRAKYKNYVPLKEMAEDEYIQSPIGGGYQVGRVINTAFGRFTRANSDLILPASIAQAKGTIAAGENAEVLRALLRQAEFAPNPDVWRLQKAVWKPYLDRDTGEVRYAPRPVQMDANYGSRAISIPVDGDRHVLIVSDQRFADAFKRSGLPLPDFMQTIGTVTRFYALMATAANPEFVVTNLMRDFQQAMIRLTGEKSPALASKVAKDMIPALWGAFSGLRAQGQYTPGESAKPLAEAWHSWYRRFIEAGGQVAYRGIADVETQHKDFLRSLADAGIYPESLGGFQSVLLKAHRAAKVSGAKFFTKLVTDANGAVENALRLSTFKNLVEAGYTEKDAAFAARNVTVDFNLKGEASTRIGALWMFFNANMQGNALLVRSVINSKGVRWLAYALFFMGMAMDAWNRRHANENKDGRTSYDNISSDMKEKNFVLMAPDGDNAITVPFSFGFNIFYMAGVNAMATIDGAQKPLKSAMNVVIGAMNAFNPMGQTPTTSLGTLQLISPTSSDPAVQAMTNRDWRDKTIVPERPKFAPPQSKAETYYSGTPPMYVDSARWLNEMSGGNEVRSGILDISPNMLRHWVNSVFGSAGATYARIADIVHATATDKELETRDIPIVRRFYYEPKDFELSHRFYEHLNEAEVAHFEVRRAYEGNRGEQARLLQEEYRGERSMYQEGVAAERTVGQIRSQIAHLRKDERVPEDVKKKRIEQAEEQSRRIMMQFNARFESSVDR